MTQRVTRPPVMTRLRSYERTARRSVSRHGFRPWASLGRLDPRTVFVVGCPRSGTSFTAAAIGAVPGFADLGELSRLKGAVPSLYASVGRGERAAVVREVRGIVTLSQRVAMVAGRRAIEQTPECTYLIPELAEALPQSRFVHLIRDGRDVATSLLATGWLADDDQPDSGNVPARVDDAGLRLGGYARFWVEPGRESEFLAASVARRCGWAWRRYVATALHSLGGLEPDRVVTVRYEDLVARPEHTAGRVAAGLGCGGKTDELAASFSRAHSRSVGRFAMALSPHQLADITGETEQCLVELGYLA